MWCGWVVDKTVGWQTPSRYGSATSAANNSEPLTTDITTAPEGSFAYWWYGPRNTPDKGGHVGLIVEAGTDPLICMTAHPDAAKGYEQLTPGADIVLAKWSAINAANKGIMQWRGWSTRYSGGQPWPFPTDPTPAPTPPPYVTRDGDTVASVAKTTNQDASNLTGLRVIPGQQVTTPTPPAPTPPTERVHAVTKGESLNSVAKNFGLTLAQLLALNPGVKPNQTLYVGDLLRVA
jgi:LysM repeat protein